MRKKLLLLLGIFALVIIPSSVYADTTGSYALDRTIYLHYNLNDKTDYYLSTTKTNVINNGPGVFDGFYQGLVGVIHTKDNKTYSPAQFQFFNSNGAMHLCDSQCDLMLTFGYGIVGRSDILSQFYLQEFRRASTNLSGVTLIGTDINDEPKRFYCTGQFVIDGDDSSFPWSKFIATCPTSNFKSISRIEINTGFLKIHNTTNFFDVTYEIQPMSYTISPYTGTQDGVGGSVSDNSEPTEEEILDAITDDNIDLNFQNSTLNNINSQMSNNNVISDLLLLPVTLYQKILTGLSANTCSPISLGTLFNTELTIPCINLSNYLGSTLWTTIDLIISGVFIFGIRKKFVDIFNNMTNLKDRGNELE